MQKLSYRDLVVEAFVHATESTEKVERAMRLFAPHARIERRPIGGHFGQPLTALRARVGDPAEVERILEQVKNAAGAEVGRTAERRVDADLRLHIRFDKQAAARGVVALEGSTENDVVKLTVRLRAPRLTRAGAVGLVQRDFAASPPHGEEGWEPLPAPST